MTPTLTLRLAQLSDLGAVDRLLSRSYPRLLKADYPPSVMVTALPLITRARPELLQSGRYWLVEDAQGGLVGAGGWSGGREAGGLADVRHVATDPDALRQGVGRALMTRVLTDVRAAGHGGMDCLSTRTAVPFYAAMGFREVGPVVIPLRPGIAFPAIRMVCAPI